MADMQILFGMPAGIFSVLMPLESSCTRFMLKMQTFSPESSYTRFMPKMKIPYLSVSINFLVEDDMLLFSQILSFTSTFLNAHFD